MKNSHRFSPTLGSQNGVVLIVALVFLVALTAVAAALMQNSTTDMKMSGASEQKVVALQEVVSAVDEVIFNQAGSISNRFARPVRGEDNFPIIDQAVLLPNTVTQSTATVGAVTNGYNLATDCPHMPEASSSDKIGCSFLSINVNRVYGRNNLSNISVESGIEQQLIK